MGEDEKKEVGLLAACGGGTWSGSRGCTDRAEGEADVRSGE